MVVPSSPSQERHLALLAPLVVTLPLVCPVVVDVDLDLVLEVEVVEPIPSPKKMLRRRCDR